MKDSRPLRGIFRPGIRPTAMSFLERVASVSRWPTLDITKLTEKLFVVSDETLSGLQNSS